MIALFGCPHGAADHPGVPRCAGHAPRHQDRIDDPKYPHPTPLAPRYLRLGVEERQDYRGQQVAAVDAAQLRERCAFLRAEAVEAVALCFLHAYANDQNEAAAAEIVATELPDVYLAVSSRLLPRIDFYRRTSTTVLDAYVGPKMAGYFARLLSRLGDAGFRGKLLVMQSNGGVIAPDLPTAAPVRTLLSGPAAGTVAGAAFARQLDYADCISLDMGGTSLDAALIMGGEPLIVGDGKLNRYDVAVPMVDIHSIGAGGGSIGWVDSGGLLHVGPQSAGAQPGPACYGFGGELPTCTDANLLLGYLNADYFLGGRMPLDAVAARQAVEEHVARPLGLSAEAAAAGMFELVNVNMAAGVRHVSLNRGYDPRDFPLVVAGGAGPIHAAMIAAELRIPVVIIPRASSTFSATGLLLADLKHDHIRTYAVACDQLDRQRVGALFAEMERARRGGARLGRRQRRGDGVPLLGGHALRRPVSRDRGAPRARAGPTARRRRLGGTLRGAARSPVRLYAGRAAGRGDQSAPHRARPREQCTVPAQVSGARGPRRGARGGARSTCLPNGRRRRWTSTTASA